MQIRAELAVSMKLKKELNGKDREDILNTKNALYSYIFTPQVRNKEICKGVVWVIIYVLLTLYPMIIMWLFWDSWEINCIRKLNEWLLVYCVLIGIHAATTISYVIMWKCAKDPTLQVTRIRVFFHVWVYLFEAGWLIYGNTFIYSDKMKNCTNDHLHLDLNIVRDYSADVSDLRTCV